VRWQVLVFCARSGQIEQSLTGMIAPGARRAGTALDFEQITTSIQVWHGR
jgi:hypothetical protein